MHDLVIQFIDRVRQQKPQFFRKTHVLEIGSLDMNGSIRPLFDETNYIGVDIVPGLGVDVVADGRDLQYPDNTFDVVVSAEVFEHCSYWSEVMANMIRMLRPGGLLMITAAAFNRPVHAGGGDTYRNLQSEDLAEYKSTALFYEEDMQTGGDIRLAWIKPIFPRGDNNGSNCLWP